MEVISGVISPLIWVIITVTLLITPLTSHEPPSRLKPTIGSMYPLTVAPKYLQKRDYFKAKVYTIWVHGPLP